MRSPTALVAAPQCKSHDTGPDHPERPERFDATLLGLEEAGLMPGLLLIEPRIASRADLELVHTPRYLDLAEAEIRAGANQLSTGDTAVSARSWDAALHAAGSVLSAVDAVMRGEAANAFCVVRPPGHHASPDRGMGFCIVNNAAIAARHLQRRHGIERVLIVDWDVHHGNGTQDAFYSDGSVFFFSTHQAPWYPGTGNASETGEGAGRGATLNCPLPAMSGREEIVGAFESRLLPAMEKFRPQFILVSAGFDSRIGDPLGQFRLTDEDFAELTRIVLNLARSHAGGRIVSMLEGGYDLTGLARASSAHVAELARPQSAQ